LWEHRRQQSFARTLESLSSVVLNLFRLSSSNIVFVDPFGGYRESIETIAYLLNSTLDNKVNSKLPHVSLFYKSNSKSPDAPHVHAEILGKLNTAIELSVMELTTKDEGDVFHNRCILTELGGVLIGHGLTLDGDENHTDDAVLMDSELYQKKWNQFVEQPEFEVISTS
jgi:hypothetical protein